MSGSRRATGLMLLGGLAWSAGLRGFMAEVAGEESSVDWADTFGWICLPGVGVCAPLGWAEHLHDRWAAGVAVARPGTLLFPAIVHRSPLALLSIFKDGWVKARSASRSTASSAAYDLSGRGPIWARVACGVLALTVIPGWALTVRSFAGPELGLGPPPGAWIALYHYSFILLPILACTFPFRAVRRASRDDGE